LSEGCGLISPLVRAGGKEELKFGRSQAITWNHKFIYDSP